MKKLFYFFLLCTSFFWSQGGFTAYQFQKTNNSASLNPAFFTNTTYGFSLVGFSFLPYFHYFVLGNDQNRNVFSNVNYYQPNAKVNRLIFIQTDLLQMSYRIAKAHHLRYHLGFRLQHQMNFNRNLFDLFNDFDKQNFEIFDFYTNSLLINQHLWGYTWQVNDKWSWGIQLKYWNIFAALYADNVRLAAEVDHENKKVTVEGQVNVLFFYPKNNFFGQSFFYSGNYGLSWDLGFSYQPISNLKISASILELGYLSFAEKNVQHYKIDGQFSFSYQKINLPNQWSDIPIIYNQIKEILNSITGNFSNTNTQEKHNNTFLLPIRGYFGVNYLFAQKHDVNFLFYGKGDPSLKKWNFYFETGIGYAFRTPVFEGFVNYHLNNYNFFNLGVGFLIHIKRLQLHFSMDNIILINKNPLLQLGGVWFLGSQ